MNKDFREIVIPIPIYRMKIYVWVCSPEVAKREIKNTVFGEYEEDIEYKAGGGKYLHKDGVDGIVWVDSNVEYPELIGNIAHEVLHAIIYSLDDRGMELMPNNHEFYTYLMGYVMAKVVEGLENAK